MVNLASRSSSSRHLAPVGAQLVGPLAFVVLVLVGAMAANPVAETATVCGDRASIMQNLARHHDEPPQAKGLAAADAVVEVCSRRRAAGPYWSLTRGGRPA